MKTQCIYLIVCVTEGEWYSLDLSGMQKYLITYEAKYFEKQYSVKVRYSILFFLSQKSPEHFSISDCRMDTQLLGSENPKENNMACLSKKQQAMF